MNEPAIVYVIDDDEAIRKSVRRLIEQVDLPIQTFASATEFLAEYEPARPACLVLDVRMPGMSGIDLQRKLAEEGANLPTIIVTGHGDIQMAVEAMRRGAIDFLEKPYRAQALLDSIHRGLDQDQKRRRVRKEAEELAGLFAQLTSREREVVEQVVNGMTNRDIAQEYGVTPQAIDARRSRAMAKLGIETIPKLVECVLRHRWSEMGYSLPPSSNGV